MNEFIALFLMGVLIVCVIAIDLRMNIKAWKQSQQLKKISEGDTKKLYK